MPTFGLGTIKSLWGSIIGSEDEIEKKYKTCKNTLSDEKKTLDQEINTWGSQLITVIQNHMKEERDALQIQYDHYNHHLDSQFADYKTLVEEEQTFDDQAFRNLEQEFNNLIDQCFQLQNVSKPILFPKVIGNIPFADQTLVNYEVLEADDHRITTNQGDFESSGPERFTNDGRISSRNFDVNHRPKNPERQNSSQDELDNIRYCPRCFMLFPASFRSDDKLGHISDHDKAN